MSTCLESTVDFDPFAGGSIERVIGTTEAQREIWLADQLSDEASLSYNESVSLRLRGPLDASALQYALDGMVARHDSLRATVSADGMNLLIGELAPCALETTDLALLDDDARAQALAEARARAVESRFDLVNGPLLRARLLRCGDDLHELVLTAHHIVCDGWSWGVIANDLGRLYARALGRPAVLEAPVSYEQFVQWDVAQGQGATMQANGEFWLKQFGGDFRPVDLPTDRSRPAARTFGSRRTDIFIEGALVERVRKAAAACEASLFAAMLGVFAGTLERLTQQSDLIVGVPSAGQSVSDLRELVGHCVNLLPIRIAVESRESMTSLVRQTGSTLLAAFDHQMTYGALLKRLPLQRDPSRPTLVSVMFNLDRDTQLDVDSTFPQLEVELIGNPRHFENFELFLNCTPTPSGLRLECQYNTGLFDDASILRWLALFESALERFSQAPADSVARVCAPSDSDAALLEQFNSTQAPFDRQARVESLFVAQARATPDAVAVTAGEQTLTYRELDERSNALAQALVQHGVAQGELIGLCCARNAHMMVALIGILKAGAGYVPLDPSFPRERLDFMAQDAQLRIVVADGVTESAWADRKVVMRADIVQATGTRVAHGGTSESVAYVIYTSGSTGRPKGVQVPHRSVVNLLTSLRADPGMRADHVVLAVTTLSFDIAVSEVLMPLTVGARIVLADKAQAAEGDRLRALIESEGVNFVDATPATWRLLLEAQWKGRPDLVAICTGEPLPPELGRQLLPRVGELWNGYGPTETTVWSSMHRVQQIDSLVPIGRPVANTHFLVLDAALQPLPVGVKGELYIGGDGVTLGYLRRPELNAERFLRDPSGHDGRQHVYKTGDIGRWRADGVLECMGRADHQVKVRGYRIELGEIEANLATHPAVAQTVIVTREDAPGDVRIVAYVVSRGDMPEAAEFKRHLSGFLPEYMVPQHFVQLPAIPLLPNGKVDRRSLPAPEIRKSANAAARVAPASRIEQAVLSLVEQVLSLPDLSMDDDFFALGGHSLLAARLTARLNRELDVQLPFRTIFESPTPARLAQAVEAARLVERPRRAPLRHESGRRSAPLTPMQQRISFLEQLHPGRPVYNAPSGHRLTGPLDARVFEAAFREVVKRQATLRTRISRDAQGNEIQWVDDDVAFEMPLHDLSLQPAAQREDQLMEAMQAIADSPLDIFQGPLFRVALFRLSEEDHAFAFVPHHLIWDGWSFDLLQIELASIYAAMLDNKAPAAATPGIAYGDYAQWLTDWLQGPEAHEQIEFWKGRLGRAPAALAANTDLPRRVGISGEGRSLWVVIDKAATEELRAVARESGATLNMLLLATYSWMMCSAIGTGSVVIAIPVRGREDPELEHVMGFFTNLLMLHLEVDETLSFVDYLRHVKQELMTVTSHQLIPFEIVAAQPEASERSGGAGLYHALFSFQDARERPSEFAGGLRHRQIHLKQRGATDDLGLWMLEKSYGLEGPITYNADIFLPETGEAFRTRLLELLEKVRQSPTDTLAALNAMTPSPAATQLRRLDARSAVSSNPASRLERNEPAHLLNPEQAELAQVWASVLRMDVNNIHASDNFFDLGGDSLLAMRAVQEAEQMLGFRIEARRYIFESLAQLSVRKHAPMPAQPPAAPASDSRRLFSRVISALGKR